MGTQQADVFHSDEFPSVLASEFKCTFANVAVSLNLYTLHEGVTDEFERVRDWKRMLKAQS